MRFFRSKKIAIKLVVFWLTWLMAGQGAVAFAGSDRIYPANRVTLNRGEKTIGVYTKEAPLPEDTMIFTDGRCAVKLDDLYLVAEDQSVFAINTSNRQRNLFIKQGVIYFKTASMSRSLSFLTPDGPIDVKRIRLHAASDSSIKGYVSIDEKRTELGIAEGGTMDVLTDRGTMTIQSGKKIILAQADMDIGLPEDEEPAAKEPPETKPKMTTGMKVLFGALGVAAIAALAGGGGGGGGGGGSVSPSTP